MTTTPHYAGVILAGGHGRRAGGPKALKKIEGELLWRVMARRLRESLLNPVVVVLHPSAMPTNDDPEIAGVIAVEADPDAPMFASLQRGLGAFADDHATFVHPVDGGLPTTEVLSALAQAHTGSLHNNKPIAVWQPRVVGGNCHGRRGHPVLLAAPLCAELLTLDPNTSRLDHVLAQLPATKRADLTWTDPAVLANYNSDGLSA